MPLYWDKPLFWDSGLTWDAGAGPSLGDVTPYLDLVTSEHRDKPNFIATLTAILQPIADGIAAANSLVTLFDVDSALGVQLDAIGLWVGRSRSLTVPISGVFFTFDTGPGFDNGILIDEFGNSTQVLLLPDEQYRTLLTATIAANHWDGTTGGAYAAYAVIFGPGGYTLKITDHQNMTIDLTLGGPSPDALTRALFLGGYLSLKPVGVQVANYFIVPGP